MAKRKNLAEPVTINSREEMLALYKEHGLTEGTIEDVADVFKTFPITMYRIPAWIRQRMNAGADTPEMETLTQQSMVSICMGFLNVAIDDGQPIFWMDKEVHAAVRKAAELD